MFSYVAKSGGMSKYFKATANVVVAAPQTISPPAVVPAAIPAVFPAPLPRLDGDSLRYNAPRSGYVKITSGINTSTKVRYAHTDIRVPDFSEYRRDATKDPRSRARDSAASRQTFTYLISGAGMFLFTGHY